MAINAGLLKKKVSVYMCEHYNISLAYKHHYHNYKRLHSYF